MACDGPESLRIGEVEYVRRDSLAQTPTGNRAVIVVDRGWIFAGDVDKDGGRAGYICLSRAVLVQSWSELGFDGMIANPKDKRVKIKPIKYQVRIPNDSEILSVPVPADWGL
jgi:hypothetical protein